MAAQVPTRFIYAQVFIYVSLSLSIYIDIMYAFVYACLALHTIT